MSENNCAHDKDQDIVKDHIGGGLHYICGNCETDFGDPIEYIIKLRKELQEANRQVGESNDNINFLRQMVARQSDAIIKKEETIKKLVEALRNEIYDYKIITWYCKHCNQRHDLGHKKDCKYYDLDLTQSLN